MRSCLVLTVRDRCARGCDPPSAEMKLMVRSLFKERFGLVARVGSREMPVQALVLARTDKALGPRYFRWMSAAHRL